MTILIVGGGIVGLATARELVGRGHSVTVLEAEDRIAAHQTGHNSGVIHSGLYYVPGSAKARLCTEGRDAMYRFCEEEGIVHRRTGKLVVARTGSEAARLDELERRGRANGLDGLERLDAAALAERFPQVAGGDRPGDRSGLWVPQTGIVDYREVAAALARKVTEGGGTVRTGARVVAIEANGDGDRTSGRPADRVAVTVDGGETLTGDFLVNCAGLHSDRVANLCRDGAGRWKNLRIVPFRGEYRELAPGVRDGVDFPIYPVPDPRFPFLGVHLTPTLDGRIEAGPNAVLALHRHGYRRPDPLAVSGLLHPRDLIGTLAFPGFWRLALRHWRFGAAEIARSWSGRLFRREMQKLVPRLENVDRANGSLRGHSGVRAQAVDRDGNLVDDFRLVHRERQVHVLNAPSPAATASLAIGRHIADRVEGRIDGWEDEEEDV